jgi:hypothetical protein
VALFAPVLDLDLPEVAVPQPVPLEELQQLRPCPDVLDGVPAPDLDPLAPAVTAVEANGLDLPAGVREDR